MRTNRVPSPIAAAKPTTTLLKAAAAAALVVPLLTALTPAQAATPAQASTQASDPGHPAGFPGAMSHFGLARKDCVGTALGSQSKVWFTVANGVLSDVYYPHVDTTNVETLQFIVTDGATFTDLQARDFTYRAQPLDASGMSCRITSTPKRGGYELITDYFTDPARASVVMRTTLRATTVGGADGLRLYVRFDPTINGNGGGGDATTQNAGADDADVATTAAGPVPVASDENTATVAANRDYARPVHAALRANRPLKNVTSGYAGTASDGLTTLDAVRSLTGEGAPGAPSVTPTAYDGNVVQVAQVDLGGPDGASVGSNVRTTLALGFASTQATALATAGRSATADPAATLAAYASQWATYDAGLLPPPKALNTTERATYRLSANVLKASEDKSFRGAIVASLASPWGQAVAAGEAGLTYWGSYREVFARDLYESVTGLLAAGDVPTAKAAVRFLFERQQQPDGSFPRNSLVNGKPAPDTFGVQLDEVAYPLVLARRVGIVPPGPRGRPYYDAHIAPAARFLLAHGPAFGSERWEEQSGYSPSTIAAEVAGLNAAAAIADAVGDEAGARLYRATADTWQRQVKAWTMTSTGTLTDEPYFIRLSKTGDPNAATTYNLGNGGPDADQRDVVDAGFLELPRLGLVPVDDPDVARSLTVVDRVIKRDLPGGPVWYRYGTPSEGTEDGYGDCFTGDPTDCVVQAKPWAGECKVDGSTQPQNKGSGHVWPVLAGERGGHAAALGDRAEARRMLVSMTATASGIGLIPEQAWENPDVAASPWGTAPECASIGFTLGKAAGSAAPLTWAAGQYVRLVAAIASGKTQEAQPDTARRYLPASTRPAVAEVTLTAPADGALVTGSTRVTGTTLPGARVDVAATNTDIDGASRTASATAGEDGTFAVPVDVPPGTVTITVAASSQAGRRPLTGTAQRTVTYDTVPGTLLFAATDPTGDDVGPGTYVYPSASDFKPGAYDLEAFEVYDSGADTVTMRVRTRDLTQTFGSPLGAQLVDVYVGAPGQGPRSTAASFPQRNYTIADDAAWTRMIEVQGFGQRFVDAAGATVGPVAIRASAATRWITFTVSKAALGGVPGPGWTFAVVLTGQDGFSPDQARGFTATGAAYQFGVCAAGATDPTCGTDPATVPKALDILTPNGVVQSDVLNLTGARTIPGLVVP